jgi:hypothetical protein
VVVRPRRPVPGDGLVVFISAVRCPILRKVSRLSVKICKLGLCKLINCGVLLSCCLRYLRSHTLSWPWGLISGNGRPELTDIILRKSSGGI